MKIPFGKPIIEQEEKKAVQEVLESPILVHGRKALDFEESFRKFTNANEAISVSSCTAGMHLFYFTLGIGPGDEVIVPAQTHVATAHAVELVGAKAVFVDVCSETGNIDPNLVRKALTKNTKAIAVVHYLGVPAKMNEINEIAREHGLFVLEDCALSPGAKFQNIHTGLHGDAGVFSFYPIKHITTAEGGMIILKDKKLADKLRLTKAFGIDRTHGERKIAGIYDSVVLGFNYRMSEIHAAIGIEQLKKLPKFLTERRQNYELLKSHLEIIKDFKILPQPINDVFKSSHYCLGLMIKEELNYKRANLMESLKIKGVGTSIYYPNPLPRMTYYKSKYGFDENQFRNATNISDSIIALPVGPHLTHDEIIYIAETVKKTWEKIND